MGTFSDPGNNGSISSLPVQFHVFSVFKGIPGKNLVFSLLHCEKKCLSFPRANASFLPLVSALSPWDSISTLDL